MTFEEFKRKYPHATYTDWWNTCAHVESGGQLPNPLASADFAVRGEVYQQEEKKKKDKALEDARRKYGVSSSSSSNSSQSSTEKKGGWFQW